MGFFNRIFKSEGTFSDTRNPALVCELTLCGQKHLVREFDLSYDPDNGMNEYFEAYAVFSEPIHPGIEQWITQAGRREEGIVKFYRNSDAMDEGALFEIQFRDASCVHYRKNVHNGVDTTTIVMTIPIISMAGEDFEIRR